MKGTPGPSGSGWEVRRRGGGRAGGRWVAGVTRRACRYGSGQGPVHAVIPVARPVPSGPLRRLREGVRAPQPDSGPAPASPPGVAARGPGGRDSPVGGLEMGARVRAAGRVVTEGGGRIVRRGAWSPAGAVFQRGERPTMGDGGLGAAESVSHVTRNSPVGGLGFGGFNGGFNGTEKWPRTGPEGAFDGAGGDSERD
jgi:hypothetical protein